MSALIFYRNTADTAREVSAPALANFPASNLLTRQLSATWRADLAGTPEIFMDRGADDTRPVRVVALLATNRAAAAATGEDIYVFGSDDNAAWYPISVTLGATDAGVPSLPGNAVTLVGESFVDTFPRYVRIRPRWIPKDGASFVEAGRLLLGDALVFPDECDGNWEFSVRDRGRIDEAAGLQVYPAVSKRQRVLRMAVTSVPTETAYGFSDDATEASAVPSLQDLMLHAGSTGEVLVLIRGSIDDAKTALWARRLGIYGHLTDDSLTIRHDDGPHYSTTLTFIEER